MEAQPHERRHGPSAPAGTRRREAPAAARRRRMCRCRTLRTPYSVVPGAAISRSATSRCSITSHRRAAARRRCSSTQLEQDRRRDVVGQVAGDAQRTPAPGRRRASASRTRSGVDVEEIAFDDREVRRRRRLAARPRGRGRSRTRRRAGARAASGRVSAPRPGPISRNVSSGCGSIARDDLVDPRRLEEVLAEPLARRSADRLGGSTHRRSRPSPRQ